MANEIIKGMGFHHIGLKAKDFNKSCEFYKALGLKEVVGWCDPVKEIKMFDKNIDVVTKGDYCAIIFRLDDGYTPADGDIVLRYQDYYEIDGSDIVN